ncbi:alkaline phosphatase family protein [Paenibacillus lignilyticus]|uniref:Alkaline phosphatase family protein n=1 Tax=Paenibacillus lignilyticus TaxID=1172615 RepID=A0ABS5C9R7_9BACL|nr:alkaline phosphatase family protein [Paenibacillus lignilyticus]
MNNEKRKIIVISIDGMAAFYLRDPQVKMPVLRKIMETGASAEAMVSIAPTATWAIHTSMVTGVYPRKHGVLGNWVIDRPAGRVGEHFGDLTWNKEESVGVPTIYDMAKARGWKTAAICWPKTRQAIALDWCIPEFYQQELFESYSTQEWWMELKNAGFPVDKYGAWSCEHENAPMQDWLTTEIAKHLLTNHNPDLLLMHYLMPDTYQHVYGISTSEVYWALEYIDERIGDLIETLKSTGKWDNTDLFIVSDHGFVNTTRTFYPNVLFKQKGWFEQSTPLIGKVAAVSNGGIGYVYVLEDQAEERTRLMDEVRELLHSTPGIARIFEPQQYAELGLPAEGEMADHCPDFIFEAELDCFIHFDHTGEEVLQEGGKFYGMHGYLPQHEQMKAIFAATGKSIQPSVKLGEIQLVDLAPTLMRLIGGELPDTDGRALDEIWKAGVADGRNP